MSTSIIRHATPISVWSDFDKIIDSMFATTTYRGLRSPAVDIREEKDRYILEAELPGYSEDQVSIRVEDRLLVMEFQKQAKTTDETVEGTNSNYLVRERANQEFRRTFSLPKDADQDRIEANYRDGLLTLSIHKSEKLAPRTISITRN